MNVKFSIKINLFKPRKEKIYVYEPSAPPYYEKKFSIQMTKTLGGKYYSNTMKITQCEKKNPKTKKLVKTVKGSFIISGRKKSQIFTK